MTTCALEESADLSIFRAGIERHVGDGAIGMKDATLQRRADVPSPASICWAMIAMAR